MEAITAEPIYAEEQLARAMIHDIFQNPANFGPVNEDNLAEYIASHLQLGTFVSALENNSNPAIRGQIARLTGEAIPSAE